MFPCWSLLQFAWRHQCEHLAAGIGLRDPWLDMGRNSLTVGHDDMRQEFVLERCDTGFDRLELSLDDQCEGTPALSASLLPFLHLLGWAHRGPAPVPLKALLSDVRRLFASKQTTDRPGAFMNAVLVAPYREISFSISARDFSTETVVPSAKRAIMMPLA